MLDIPFAALEWGWGGIDCPELGRMGFGRRGFMARKKDDVQKLRRMIWRSTLFELR